MDLDDIPVQLCELHAVRTKIACNMRLKDTMVAFKFIAGLFPEITERGVIGKAKFP
jgi:hypothetical protein